MLKVMRLLPVLVMLAFGVSYGVAQDGEAGWPVVERCVGEPTTPPEGWTFEGTILSNGEYGIYGFRSDWETRHVLNFTNSAKESLDLYQGSLSPDMQWYAAARGDYWCSGSCRAWWTDIYSIVVFDISGDNPRSFYSIRWPLGYRERMGDFDAPPLVWLDDEHLVFPRGTDIDPTDTIIQVLNPFNEEMIEWTGDNANCIRCSPDRTRNIEYDFRSNHYSLVDRGTQETLHSFDTSIASPLSAWVESWSPDSQFFLGLSTNNGNQYLTLYDRDGEAVDNILELNNFRPRSYYDTFELLWSPDSNHFWIEVTTREDETEEGFIHHYLVHVAEQQVVELDMYTDTEIASCRS